MVNAQFDIPVNPRQIKKQLATKPSLMLVAAGLLFLGGCAGLPFSDQRRGGAPSAVDSGSHRNSGNVEGSGFFSSFWGGAKSDFKDSKDVIQAIEKGTPRSQAIAFHAIELIREGKLGEANTVLNAALKLDISNKNLHFLNGVAYHLRYLKGEADCFELARSGYLAAIGDTGSIIEAFIQLGRLSLTAKDYPAAKQTFSEAIALEPDNTAAIYGMAHAALFEGDIKTVFYSIERLHALKWTDPLLLRLEAAVLALSGKKTEALEKYARFEERTGDKRDGQFARRRLNTLANYAVSTDRPNPTVIDTPLRIAQAAGAEAAPAKAASAESKADTKPAPESKGWFRCDTAPGIPLQEKAVPPLTVAATDETLVPLVLPKPCDGETVPLAIVEVALIRTEETESKSFGVNLLDGLTGVFRNVTTRIVTEAGTPTFTRTRTFGIAAGDDASKHLSYSLNIANSAFAKNEVIARPTLAAVDRVPSVFFSGATITLGVGGVAGSSSTVVDKPVGVSLAITPTFVDDESVLLSLRATRSFIETGLTSGTAVLLQQTRNMVNATAMLKYGESFVLSGLVEREIDANSTGVPVLGEIPLVQYLFKKDQKLDFRRQILTLVTVRKVVSGDGKQKDLKLKEGELSTHKLSERINEFFRLQKKRPVIDELLEVLQKDNQLYRRLIDRDVLQESWSSQSRLDRTLKEFKDAIYY